MNNHDFNQLLESVREGRDILRGTKEPSRRFVVDRQEIRDIRENLSLSQGNFASMMGVSINTVQNWEQGRRTPTGPARVLLTIIQHKPTLLSEPWFCGKRPSSIKRKPSLTKV